MRTAEDAVRVDPNDRIARSQLAAAYLSVGRYSDALKQAEYGIQLNPDEGTNHLIAGVAQRELGRHDRAIEFIGAALNDPNKTSDWYLKANIELTLTYEAKGDLEGAKSSLDGALGFFPEAADLYYERGRITEKLGDLEGALLDYQAVLQFIPDNELARDAVVRVSKALETKPTTTTETAP